MGDQWDLEKYEKDKLFDPNIKYNGGIHRMGVFKRLNIDPKTLFLFDAHGQEDYIRKIIASEIKPT